MIPTDSDRFIEFLKIYIFRDFHDFRQMKWDSFLTTLKVFKYVLGSSVNNFYRKKHQKRKI